MKNMKNIKTFEGFIDKFREEKAGTDLIPEPEEIDIRGEKIGRINSLNDLDGKVLFDPETDLQLYIDTMGNYMELIDPDGNDGRGKVIDTYDIPEPGKMAPLDEDEEPDEDGNYTSGVYLDDNISYLEFIEDDKVTHEFSLSEAEDITDIIS